MFKNKSISGLDYICLATSQFTKPFYCEHKNIALYKSIVFVVMKCGVLVLSLRLCS